MIKSSFFAGGPCGGQDRLKSNRQRGRGTTGLRDSPYLELEQTAVGYWKLAGLRPKTGTYLINAFGTSKVLERQPFGHVQTIYEMASSDER